MPIITGTNDSEILTGTPGEASRAYEVPQAA